MKLDWRGDAWNLQPPSSMASRLPQAKLHLDDKEENIEESVLLKSVSALCEAVLPPRWFDLWSGNFKLLGLLEVGHQDGWVWQPCPWWVAGNPLVTRVIFHENSLIHHVREWASGVPTHSLGFLIKFIFLCDLLWDICGQSSFQSHFQCFRIIFSPKPCTFTFQVMEDFHSQCYLKCKKNISFLVHM